MNYNNCLKEAMRLDCGMRCKHLGLTEYMPWRDTLKYIGEANKDLSEKLIYTGFWELDSKFAHKELNPLPIEMVSNSCHQELKDIDICMSSYIYLSNKYGEDLANEILYVHHKDSFTDEKVYRIKNAEDESTRFNPYLIDMVKFSDSDRLIVRKSSNLEIEDYDCLETGISLKFY